MVDTWEEQLDLVQKEIENAKKALARGVKPEEQNLTEWEPPLNLGQIPAALAPRARALLEEQAEVNAQLKERLVDMRKIHQSMKTTESKTMPLYLNVEG